MASEIAQTFTDEDMAQVGRDLMEEIAAHSENWPVKGWGPMDTPAEIVTDLVNIANALKAENEARQDDLKQAAQMLAIFLGHDERFQPMVGGNPNAVDAMLDGVRAFHAHIAALSEMAREARS